jgi:hypothetical protein
MKFNQHQRARPNLAGLTSPAQQAEMKSLVAGRWPPLKPLPVFKYETEEYRASIDFDKLRGEWVCRKTSLPSNKVQELRGGLAELTMALPHGPAEVFAECAAAAEQDQEFEKHASRRLQAILEWKANYENGVLYSGLQAYLSENQQDELDDSIQLTLTARQLQFNPKNVAYVFDALSKAGGKLATLIEIARRNQRGQGTDVPPNAEAPALQGERQAPVEAIDPTRDRRLLPRSTPASRAFVALGDTNTATVLNISETGMAVAAADPLVVADYLPRIRFQLPNSGPAVEISAQIVWLADSRKSAGIQFVDLTAEARNQISNWIASEKPAQEFERLTPAPLESLIPATLESLPEVPTQSAFPEQDETSSPELIAPTSPQSSTTVTPEILKANPPSFVEALQEEVRRHAPVAGFGPQVRTGKFAWPAARIENSPSRPHVLEITGFQVAAVVFLFAVTSLAVVLTVGRGPLGKRLTDAQNSTPAADATSPALLNRPDATASRTPTPTATQESRSESLSAQSLHARSEESTSPVGPIAPSPAITTNSLTDSDNPEVSPDRKGPAARIARNATPPAISQPAHSPRAAGPTRGEPARLAPRKVVPLARAAPRLPSPSTILVSGPGDGSKPFRLILPEKPIAASSSFAMTSQLSVLVFPEPGTAPAYKPARLQAGELVSFVWPRYPTPGARHASSETVKVRTTIGELGQVLDIKHVSGSISLLPAATSAIRLWHYKPTLLNRRPVKAQMDVTIEFRPPQRLPRARTRHPHN